MIRFFRQLGWLFDRRRKEAELREELEFHLEEEAERGRDAGLPEREARWAARRELGNLGLVQEDTRSAWGWTMVEQLGQDLRYAFRTIKANRLFTLLAVASLALGIGANTAIFSFMDAILLRSLPVADPGSLVVLNWHAKDVRRENGFVMHAMSGSAWGDRETGVTSGMFPYPAFELLRKSPVFSVMFGHFSPWFARRLNVTVAGQADVAAGEFVTGDFFGGMGVPPAAGRLIMGVDDRPGAPPVAVISHSLSETRFGGPANAAGRQILIDNLPFTVVGVAPAGFFGVDPAWVPDIYLPMHTNELLAASSRFGFRPADYLDDHYYWIQVMGRLRPGVTRAQAQAALAPVFHQWVDGTADGRERANLPALVLNEGAGGLGGLRRRYSKPLYVLMALVGLILAVACANVANLLLARSAARSREMALRLSVGAGRLRLVRQLLTESVLLASLGGTVGVLLAIWGMRFLTLLLANGRANFTLHAELNWRVLAAAAALSLLTGVLFGLAPALRATRVDVMPALKQARAGQPRVKQGIARLGLSNALMAGQIAISLVMLFAAGLFVRTLSNLEAVDLGFTRDNVLLFQLDARKAGHKDPEIARFYAELRRRLAEIPGVRAASLSEDSLIQAGTGLPINLPGQRPRDDTRMLTVGPAFFTTMQIRLLAGRDFDDRDRAGSPAVAIVNEVFAKANFGNRNPLGQRLILHQAGPGEPVGRDMEIVGVAANSRYGGLTREIAPVVYMPYDQGYPEASQMVYALRTAGDPLGYVAAVREAVRRADARVPVSEIRTQAADIDQTISQQITFARLCSGFGILALLIASVGLYGTVSYGVARRTGEIGIRMALGAPRGSVLRLVLRQVVALAVIGLAIGAATSLATSRFVESFLYGLKPNDPWTLTAAALVLLCAALAAAYAPAWKAARIDPAVALRHE